MVDCIASVLLTLLPWLIGFIVVAVLIKILITIVTVFFIKRIHNNMHDKFDKW